MPAYHRLTQLTAIPCRCRGFLSRPIPEAFLQQLRQQAVVAAGGGSGSQPAGDTEQAARGWQGGASGDEGEDAAAGHSEAAGEHESAAPGSKRRRPVFRVNQSVRQRWIFRRALVRTLLLLQLQVTGWPAPVQQQAASGKTAGRQARRRSSAPQQQQQQQQVQWQPGFDPAAVTAAQLQAAGEQLSAPARAAAEAAEQEAADADALATARRLAGSSGSTAPLRAGGKAGRGSGGSSKGGGAGSGFAAPTARQQGAARPPQLMKQYPPCTDTTQMGPRQFLEHLKQLPWHQGQVREGYVTGVIAHARLFHVSVHSISAGWLSLVPWPYLSSRNGGCGRNRQQKCHAGNASLNDLDVLRCR